MLVMSTQKRAWLRVDIASFLAEAVAGTLSGPGRAGARLGLAVTL